MTNIWAYLYGCRVRTGTKTFLVGSLAESHCQTQMCSDPTVPCQSKCLWYIPQSACLSPGSLRTQKGGHQSEMDQWGPKVGGMALFQYCTWNKGNNKLALAAIPVNYNTFKKIQPYNKYRKVSFSQKSQYQLNFKQKTKIHLKDTSKLQEQNLLPLLQLECFPNCTGVVAELMAITNPHLCVTILTNCQSSSLWKKKHLSEHWSD